MPFNPLLFRLYASDLAEAVHQLARERQMGIAQIKQELAHVPGISQLTMQAGQNGRTDVYRMGDVEFELPAGARVGHVAAAIALQTKKKLSSLS